MTHKEPSFTLGIEEEYLLVDLETMDLAIDPPPSLLRECRRRCRRRDQVSRELLRSQIEVGTRKCSSVHSVRRDLKQLRRAVIEAASEHGLAPIAASTHPFAQWTLQKQTARKRYKHLGAEMAAAAERLLICGMHVHVGIEDNDLRIDLLSQMAYFLPHLLALTTSSPFWEGRNTGLKSYRLTVYDALPRSGLPEHFSSHGEYQRHVHILKHAGLIEDATMIWWDLRPSARYPTLEARIFDMCTDLDDAVCVAALTRCILRRLYRLRLQNQRWRQYNRMLVNENRWRAMRYGTDEGLIDLAKGELVAYRDLLQEILELIDEDAKFFGCEKEVAHARRILRRGTSAHQQVGVLETAMATGRSRDQALRDVVRFLIDKTRSGI